MEDGAFLTKGLDGCLFVYTKAEWEKLSYQLNSLPLTGSDARAFSRYLFANAIELNFDLLGRIKIPTYLLEEAKIVKEVSIVGVSNRVEIWSKENYLRLNKKIAKDSETIAEKLSGSGI